MEPKHPSPWADSGEVTRDDVAHIEKLLELVHRNHACLAGIAQWLLVWECIQLLSVRFSRQGKLPSDVGADYQLLLRGATLIGQRLLEKASGLGITEIQFKLATNCDRKSVVACIEFLKDQIAIWFEPTVDAAASDEIWKSFASEPIAGVQVSA